MATEQFNYVIKELYVQYKDFIEFKNSEDENKVKDSLLKPEKIHISFVEFGTLYATWLRSQELEYISSDDDEELTDKEYQELDQVEETPLEESEEDGSY